MAGPAPSAAIGIDELRALRFCSELDEKTLEAIVEIARREAVPEGGCIMREGEAADALRIIEQGRVRLSMQGPAGAEVTVATLSRGEVLGGLALIPESRWPVTARAMKPCQFVTVPAEALRELCGRDPTFGLHLTQLVTAAMAARLHDAQLQLLDIFGAGEHG